MLIFFKKDIDFPTTVTPHWMVKPGNRQVTSCSDMFVTCKAQNARKHIWYVNGEKVSSSDR